VRGRRRDRRGGDDQPDQVNRGSDIEQEAGAEAADDEGGRAPHAHRAVGAAEAAEPAERVGIRQRHDRRVEHRREYESHRDGNGALRETDRAIADNRASGREHDRQTQGVVPVGAARGDRDREHAHDHRDREHDPDHVGIEAFGREPDRQERQLHAERNEQRGVKQRQPRRKRSAELGRGVMRDGRCVAAVCAPASVVGLQSRPPADRIIQDRRCRPTRPQRRPCP
jgi:hypothetical protein